VLLEKVLEMLDIQKGETVLDGTLGAGGYAAALLERIGEEGSLIALDRDPQAVREVSKKFEGHSNIFFCHINYSDFERALESRGLTACDKAVLDLGLSRDQLLDPARAFSFSSSAPLDMRIDSTEDIPTLADLLSTIRERDLADMIWRLGEERRSRRVAREILEARQAGRLRSALDLAEAIQRAIPRGRSRLHPATRTFQAFRIAVNRELEHLTEFLEKIPRFLSRKGRVAVVSFHSLEDRMIKDRFRRLAAGGEFRLMNKKVITASFGEIRTNPSARSAKLRVLERLSC